MTTAAGRPAVLVGVDTEADDQWSASGRERLSVANVHRLPAFQDLCDRFGVRPTYLVTWEMADRAESASVLGGLARGGRCEVGAHLHPWSSPPFRPEDLGGHTYPHNLPPELLERQLTDLTAAVEASIGTRPRSYRAGRNGFDHRTLPVLERLGYAVDTSVDPLFNERRKGGMAFPGAPVTPYHPDRRDVTRPGDSPVLEVPITAGTSPALPKPLEALYARLRPIPWRGAFRRLGLRPVWLRPSYASREEMLRFAGALHARGHRCFNVIFHSSELLPGGSPYNPDERSVRRFLDDLEALFEHLAGRLGAEGLTYSELAATLAAAPASAGRATA